MPKYTTNINIIKAIGNSAKVITYNKYYDIETYHQTEVFI